MVLSEVPTIDNVWLIFTLLLSSSANLIAVPQKNMMNPSILGARFALVKPLRQANSQMMRTSDEDLPNEIENVV
jgi:hypothetical protein